MKHIKEIFKKLTIVLLIAIKMPFAIWVSIIDWCIKQVKSL